MAELSRFQEKTKLNSFLDKFTDFSLQIYKPESNLEPDSNFNPINVSSSMVVERKKDGIYAKTGQLLFKVAGLSIDNTHRLKVALRVSYPDDTSNSYYQSLDLYRSDERNFFAETAFQETGIKESLIKTELKRLIDFLDRERSCILDGKLPEISSEMTDGDKEAALDYLKNKDLLSNIRNDIQSIGLVGEQTNSLLFYLSLTSRISSPFSVLLLSRSSAGKSHFRDSICSLMPEESLRTYTHITPKALLNGAKNLNQKILSIDNLEGIRDCLPYLKSIIADKRLSSLCTIPDTRTEQQAIQNHQVGVSVIVSCTNAGMLNEDIRSLFLPITLDESEEQTRRVIEYQLLAESVGGQELIQKQEQIQKLHRNIQRLLKPLSVCFPNDIEISYPANCLHNRRDMSLFLSLVKTVALLHQYQRDTSKGMVIVEKSDIQTAIELSREPFSISHDELTPQARTVLNHIRSFISDNLKESDNSDEEITFSRRDIRSLCGWSESYLRIFFKELLRKEYIGRISGKQGQEYLYVLLDSNEIAELRSDFALKAS